MGSTIMLNVNTDDAIRLYQSGKSLTQIAEQLNVSATTIARRMASAGYEFRRTNAEIGAIIRRRKYGDISSAIARYVAGSTMQDVCREFKLPRRHLEKEIVAAGEKLRTQAQSLGLRYTRMSIAERRSITARANIAVRGKKASPARQERRARTNELTLQLASRADLILCVWLAQRGVKLVPQKALGPYNLDIAIEELRVAVEVNGPWHYFSGRADAEKKRRKYLLDSGWRLIEVTLATKSGRPWKFLRPACADKIIALLDAFRTGESVRCEDCVIGGDGQPFAG